MKRLIDTIIKKWFCCHEWEYLFERRVEVVDDWGDSKFLDKLKSKEIYE